VSGRSKLTQKQAGRLYQILSQTTPSPTTELKHSNPFELLIAVILSAQATDRSVNKATQTLFSVARTPSQIRALGVKGLKAHIKTIGLYNTKTKNILRTCSILEDEYDSKVPGDRKQLETLPGVGRKTANVVLNTAFGEPTIGVDTHIFRVSNRTGLAPGKNALAVEQELLKITPKQYIKDAHHLLILHGRHTCVARRPKCLDCTIQSQCKYEKKLGP